MAVNLHKANKVTETIKKNNGMSAFGGWNAKERSCPNPTWSTLHSKNNVVALDEVCAQFHHGKEDSIILGCCINSYLKVRWRIEELVEHKITVNIKE